MKRIRLFSVLALLVAASGCQRLPDTSPATMATLEAIPMDYGEVIGVTPHGAQPYQAVLWFERPDKTIVALRVNLGLASGVGPDPLVTIPRR